MGRRGATQVITQEIMEEISDPRRSQKNTCKEILKKEETDAATATATAAAAATLLQAPSQALKGHPEENMVRRIDLADDLQLMCTKKCIPCHRCGSSMKFFMRRVKYLNTVKEYPAYRCMKKKCQTFRSPRTLARECNMLLRQGFGDGRFLSVAPTTNATRQLKEAFPDHFNKQEIDSLAGFPVAFRDDCDGSSAASSIMREKEAWYALNNAKRSLDALVYSGGGLSIRLYRIISEIHAMTTQFSEFPKKEEPVNTAFEYSASLKSDGMHDLEDEGYDSSLSMRRSTTTDLSSLTFGGDSRSSLDTEMKSETSSVDTSISRRISSSTSALSPVTGTSQPLHWINISRHSPSFSVKMVDSSGSTGVIRRTNEQEVHMATGSQLGTTLLESRSNSTGVIRESTRTTNAMPLLPNMCEQPSTSSEYAAVMDITPDQPSVAEPSTSEGKRKDEPVPIYIRPNELCFDDVADGGEILSEFFMPSTSGFKPVNYSTAASEGSNTEPVTFAQLWNFQEQYDHKTAKSDPSPSCDKIETDKYEEGTTTTTMC